MAILLLKIRYWKGLDKYILNDLARTRYKAVKSVKGAMLIDADWSNRALINGRLACYDLHICLWNVGYCPQAITTNTLFRVREWISKLLFDRRLVAYLRGG